MNFFDMWPKFVLTIIEEIQIEFDMVLNRNKRDAILEMYSYCIFKYNPNLKLIIEINVTVVLRR
jgi:hypothetical protein